MFEVDSLWAKPCRAYHVQHEPDQATIRQIMKLMMGSWIRLVGICHGSSFQCERITESEIAFEAQVAVARPR